MSRNSATCSCAIPLRIADLPDHMTLLPTAFTVQTRPLTSLFHLPEPRRRRPVNRAVGASPTATGCVAPVHHSQSHRAACNRLVAHRHAHGRTDEIGVGEVVPPHSDRSSQSTTAEQRCSDLECGREAAERVAIASEHHDVRVEARSPRSTISRGLVIPLDEAREQPTHADPVRSHEHRATLALVVTYPNTQRVSVSCSELKDVAHFDSGPPREHSSQREQPSADADRVSMLTAWPQRSHTATVSSPTSRKAMNSCARRPPMSPVEDSTIWTSPSPRD